MLFSCRRQMTNAKSRASFGSARASVSSTFSTSTTRSPLTRSTYDIRFRDMTDPRYDRTSTKSEAVCVAWTHSDT